MEKRCSTKRIDDLGRIVIPKEIRKAMHIHADDLLEIVLQEDRSIVIRPYNSMVDYAQDLEVLAQDLQSDFEKTNQTVENALKIVTIIDLINTAVRGVKALYGYSEDN